MPKGPDKIQLQVPKARVAADLRGMVGHMVQAAAHGALLQNWGNAIGSLASAAGTFRIKHSVDALAWQLLLTGIGEALTEVANQQPPSLINQRDVDTILSRIEREATDVLIPVNFLDYPWNLPPVVLAKNTLLAWLSPPPETQVPQDLANLGRRFDAALVLGLHRTIRRQDPHYRPLLDLRNDPTGPSWQVLEDWRLYRAWLISEFRTASVFDENFAVDQLYVPLNAWHHVKREPDREGGQRKSRAVVRLDDDTVAWLRCERGGNRLRLVSGGPGSGKSTAMKALAATLVEKGNDNRPADVLLFPLQRFQWRSGIVESVGVTLGTYADGMRHNPLEPAHLRERENPLLLIFDGLDELTASAQVGEAISATFLRDLSIALQHWEDRPVWVIVTGRDAIFGNIEGPESAIPGERYHLLPYRVWENEPNGLGRCDYYDPDGLLSIDNRENAFRLFAKAKGMPADELPMMYRHVGLHDVSAQPLLNYFMLTGGTDEIESGNLARIYSRLFQQLHARNRNDKGRSQDAGKPAAGLSQDQFDRVFETMAVAAWRTGGRRAASWDGILEEVKREDSYLKDGGDRLEDIFEKIDPGAQRPFRLAAAFFSRNNQATGVEFTHKSFADYLYARRLAKAVSAMADILLQAPEAEEGVLQRWAALTSAQRMSHEVARFLHLEIKATADTATIGRRCTTLKPVVERVIRKGWYMHGETSQRRAEQLSSQMEEALFIAWHATWQPNQDGRFWRLGENTSDLLRRVLARQEGVHGRQFGNAFVANLSGADLGGANLNHLYLPLADLSGANLAGAVLAHSYLEGTVLHDASLEGTILVRAILESSALVEANLTSADLSCAIFANGFLPHSVLYGANLDSVDLSQAVLRSADLRCANFIGANLRGADLRNADLRGANLAGADFRRADLTGADVRGVDMSVARLE